MDGFLAERVASALSEARLEKAVRRSRYRVVVDEQTYPIIKIDDRGFSIAAEKAPSMRGYVDIYDGPHHIGRQLVVLASHGGGEAVYEYKLQSAECAAPADYVRSREAVAGVLTGPPSGL